ncbi:DEP domain-containing mTOR-interacting protein-like [Babylonia areolata]|uniref:DEP domain-containing mTOR-interacting protein-like n=1 Tax=Babylonia areolata TaxID=304850 RepID=UPI003FD2810E
MLGKDRQNRNGSSYDIYVVGEHVRSQMLKVGLIKDRRYHLRKYRKCFIGRDAIDWLVKMCHVQSRGEAILAMRCLQEHDMLHHVVDDHVFKDQHLFYRFTRDDDRYLLRTDLATFYRGLSVFLRVKESKIQRELYHKGHLYQGAFQGVDLVDCLTANDDKLERHDVIQQCRQLLEFDIIRHITDDYHFADDRLMYQFQVDYDRPCLLSDVLQPLATDPDTHQASSSHALPPSLQTGAGGRGSGSGGGGAAGSEGGSSLDTVDSCVLAPSHSSLDSNNSNSFLSPQPATSDTSHAIRGADNDLGPGGEEEEDCLAMWSLPFGRSSSSAAAAASSAGASAGAAVLGSGERGLMVRRVVKMEQDEVGYGFVLRGSSPCYVHTIDPLGPAAAAGLKEGQYVLSVNGKNMKNQDHRHVGRVVMSHVGLLTLVVLSHTNTRP